MDFSNQAQIVYRQPGQPLVLEIDMNYTSQRNAVIQKPFHTSVCKEGLACSTHPLYHCRSTQLLGIFHITRDDSTWNPIVIEFAHYRHQLFFHTKPSLRLLLAAIIPNAINIGKCALPISRDIGKVLAQLSFGVFMRLFHYLHTGMKRRSTFLPFSGSFS